MRSFKMFHENDIFEFEDENLKRTIDLNFDFDCESQSDTIESCVQDQKRAILRSLQESCYKPKTKSFRPKVGKRHRKK